MKKLFTLSACLFLFINLFTAQEEINLKKFKTLYYNDMEILNNDVVTVSIKNVVAQDDFCKLALTIENKTNDYLIFQEGDNSFVFESGKQDVAKKEHLIEPNKTETKTLEVNEKGPYKYGTFTFNFGGLSRISSDGKMISAPSFILPESVNGFEAGDFEVSLKGKKKETDETKVSFICVYKGDAVGLVNASKISVSVEGGKTFANDDKKSKTILLRKGEKTKISASFHIPRKVVDMQFADLNLIWNDTFTESEIVALNISKSTPVQLDIETTKEKK